MPRLLITVTASLTVSLAASACTTRPPQRPATPASRTEGLRSSEEVGAALQAAQRAYVSGDWGEAVVQSNRVIEGAASPDEYYAAVKILGLASCSRRDPRPAVFAARRLQPHDLNHLREVCQQNGVTLPASP
jgi:hypothetical protein